jgi:phage terminase large subunit-like protein
LFANIFFEHVKAAELPKLTIVGVCVDPAVTNNEKSDSQAIQVAALGEDDNVYMLWSWMQRSSPEDAINKALTVALTLRASWVGIETDQGGDLWQSTYRNVAKSMGLKPAQVPRFRAFKAGSVGSKVHRAQMMKADYELGKIKHLLGTHNVLERAMKRFPMKKPYDIVDAAYWAWRYVRRGNLFVVQDFATDVRIA